MLQDAAGRVISDDDDVAFQRALAEDDMLLAFVAPHGAAGADTAAQPGTSALVGANFASAAGARLQAPLELKVDITPSVSILTDSGTDYDFPSALAELVDNAISATERNRARRIPRRVSIRALTATGAPVVLGPPPVSGSRTGGGTAGGGNGARVPPAARRLSDGEDDFVRPRPRSIVIEDNGCGMSLRELHEWATLGCGAFRAADVAAAESAAVAADAAVRAAKAAECAAQAAVTKAMAARQSGESGAGSGSGSRGDRGRGGATSGSGAAAAGGSLSSDVSSATSPIFDSDDVNAPKFLLGTFSRYGMGSKVAVFQIAGAVRVVTRPAGARLVYEAHERQKWRLKFRLLRL